jgi:tripartite-type tricarboxylate transporter receptor subunit TctC
MMAEPSPMAPAAFADFVKAELAKYERVVKASGVTLD